MGHLGTEYLIVMFCILFVEEEMLELMRKDMVELKRNLNDEVREKELFSKINDELRGTIKKNEGEKTELNRDLCDHRQKCSSK